MPNTEAVFFERSSHMLFYDEPEKFDETVKRFVAGAARRKPRPRSRPPTPVWSAGDVARPVSGLSSVTPVALEPV
jgi:hypothetical protein